MSKFKINDLGIQKIGLNATEVAARKLVINSLVAKSNLQNVKIHDATSSPYVIGKGDTQDVTNFVSQLGTPVYSNVIFNAGQVFASNGNKINSWEDFRIDDVLFQVSQGKKIVTTEIQGRDGTVKEYIGLDDFQVQITGRLNGKYNVNPKEQTKQLKEILDAGQPLAITNWWLQNLGITDIVVQNYSFEQTEGEYSTQYFTINAISDKVVEATITQ
jgi:hypothetical protein